MEWSRGIRIPSIVRITPAHGHLADDGAGVRFGVVDANFRLGVACQERVIAISIA
jgi:hypothetical protein